MDTTHFDIEFDPDGRCRFCWEYDGQERNAPSSEECKRQLKSIINEMKERGRGREYDCALGVSGGVDSSFLAYKLREWGLRVLAIQFDNGWNSELSVKNIEQICRKLDIDLFTYVVDWEEFRDLQLSFLKASVANIEAPSDHGIFSTLFHTVAERDIKYLVSGVNRVTESIGSRSWGYSYMDLKQIHDIHGRFGSIPLKTFPTMGLLKRLFYLETGRVKIVQPLNLISYNQKEAIRTLKEKLDWRYYGGKHFESIITRFHQAYVLPRKTGVDKRRGHLSNLICSGQMSREEALEELKRPSCSPEMIKHDLEFVTKKLDISTEEFERLVARPEVSYREYPNHEWLQRNIVRYYGLKRRILRLARRNGR